MGQASVTPLGPRWVRVFNTTGSARTEAAEVRLTSDIGTQSVRVFDEAGKEVPCQFVPQRKYLPHDLAATPIEAGAGGAAHDGTQALAAVARRGAGGSPGNIRTNCIAGRVAAVALRRSGGGGGPWNFCEGESINAGSSPVSGRRSPAGLRDLSDRAGVR